MSNVAVGVDRALGRWVAVVLEGGRFAEALGPRSLEELVAAFPNAKAIGVDIPIGLGELLGRMCDREARKLLGPRWNTVFPAPPQAVLEAASYDAARALCAGLSRQSWALKEAIQEAEVVAATRPAVFEAHPELSFRALAGRPLAHTKHSWAGMWARLDLLHRAGIDLPPELPGANDVPPDDVIDAAAAAWSAARRARGEAVPVAEPEILPSGRPVSIWY